MKPRRKGGLLGLIGAGLVLIVTAGPADGAPGALDRSFGGDGRVTTNITQRPDGAAAVVVQPDGRIVAGGSTAAGRFALIRYLPNGALDPSFDFDGRVVTGLGRETSGVRGLALQPDGKIVAVGSLFAGTGPVFKVVRYLPDGRRDARFGDHGVATADFPNYEDLATSVALQSDGRIVVAGWTGSGGDTGATFAVARFLPGGRLDPSFGGDGMVITEFLPHVTDTPRRP